MTKEILRGNIDEVLRHLDAASARFGEKPALCAVTKTVGAEWINMAAECGVSIIGENRVQEALQKFPALNPQLSLHMIGQLQTNKVKYIVEHAAMIQSVDRLALAEEIDRRGAQVGRAMPVLIQVNIAKEPQKAGIYEEALPALLERCAQMKGLSVRGLMAIMPFEDDLAQIRPHFRRMRELYEKLGAQKLPNVTMQWLSMGMSGDYVMALEEGANMVRVGSSIFGMR